MPVLSKLEKHKSSPVAIIYQGAEPLGLELSKLLIEQGAFVILLDEYSQRKKDVIKQLLNEELFSFIDISGTSSIADSIVRVDYIFYFNHELADPLEEVSTRDFLEKSNRLDRLLQLGIDKKAKFLLTTSIMLHQLIQTSKEQMIDTDLSDESLKYTALEVQRYSENLTREYYKRGGLDARIVRIGHVLGEGADLREDTLLGKYIRSAIKGEKIIVEGDGLENLYFIHVLDAAYGLIKAEFTEKASGKIYSLAIPRDITVLNLAYKILDLEPKAAGIDFVEKKMRVEVNIYKPATNLKDLGWKPKVSFERGLAQTIDYAYSILSKNKAVVKKEVLQKSPIQQSEPKEHKKRRSLKDMLINFFFEVSDEKEKSSVLDNIKYKQAISSKKETKTMPVLKENVTQAKPFSLQRNDQTVDEKVQKKKKIGGTSTVTFSIVKFFGKIKQTIRSLTVSTFVGYSVIAVLSLVIYITFIMPALRVGYYSVVTYVHVNQASSNYSKNDFVETQENLEAISRSLSQIEQSVDDLSYLSSLRVYKQLDSLKGRLSHYSNIVEGLKLVNDDLIAFQLYKNEYESNINLLGNDGLVASGGKAYELPTPEELEAQLAVARQKLTASTDTIKLSESKIPLLGNKIKDCEDKIEGLRAGAESVIDTLPLIATLLGTDGEKTYAVLLRDNTHLNVGGGKVVAVVILIVKDGAVGKVDTYSPSEIPLTLSAYQSSIVKSDLGGLYPENGLNFSDITLIQDSELFSSLINITFNKTFQLSPDTIILVNLDGLKQLFTLFDGVELSGKGHITADNFNENVTSQDIAFKELLAKSVKSLFGIDKARIFDLGSAVFDQIENENITITSSNRYIREYIASETNQFENQDGDRFSLSYIQKEGAQPKVQLESRIFFVNQNTNLEHRILLSDSSGEGSTGTLVVDIGNNATIESVFYNDSQVETLGKKIMIPYTMSKDGKVTVIIKASSSSVVKRSDTEYNYTVLLDKTSGVSFDYDLNIDFEGKEILASPEGGSYSENVLEYSGTLTKDLPLTFVYTAK